MGAVTGVLEQLRRAFAMLDGDGDGRLRPPGRIHGRAPSLFRQAARSSWYHAVRRSVARFDVHRHTLPMGTAAGGHGVASQSSCGANTAGSPPPRDPFRRWPWFMRLA